jgi:metal-dependent hydrolase (beta-lactamase superfamily II)
VIQGDPSIARIMDYHWPSRLTFWEAATVLFDAGPVNYAFERNEIPLGVAFGSVEAVVLSPGHLEPAGEIPRALSFISQENGGVQFRSTASGYVPAARYATGVGQSSADATVLAPKEW